MTNELEQLKKATDLLAADGWPSLANAVRNAQSTIESQAATVAELQQERAIDAESAVAIAEIMHYPACWDTAAYPSIESAIQESIGYYFKCNCDECPERIVGNTKPSAVDGAKVEVPDDNTLHDWWMQVDSLYPCLRFMASKIIQWDRQNRATKPVVSEATFESLVEDVVLASLKSVGNPPSNEIYNARQALTAFHVHALQSPIRPKLETALRSMAFSVDGIASGKVVSLQTLLGYFKENPYPRAARSAVECPKCFATEHKGACRDEDKPEAYACKRCGGNCSETMCESDYADDATPQPQASSHPDHVEDSLTMVPVVSKELTSELSGKEQFCLSWMEDLAKSLGDGCDGDTAKAILAMLKQRLLPAPALTREAVEAVEPVAWMFKHNAATAARFTEKPFHRDPASWIPLYTSPPQGPTPRALTDDDIAEIVHDLAMQNDGTAQSIPPYDFARAIERKLKDSQP